MKFRKKTRQDKPAEIEIPYVDVRETGFVGLASDFSEHVKEAVKKTHGDLGIVTRVLLPVAYPVMDFFSLRWLKRSENPHHEEVKAIKKIVKKSGIAAQNVAYEWTCTTGALKTPSGDGPKLVRVMDWFVKGMGEFIVVARHKGEAGDFHSIMVPGLTGVFNGVAKGRFAASINQAPLRHHKFGNVVTDFIAEHVKINKSKALPPPHLLRKAFETAENYEQAKQMLMQEPVTAPVIFTLTGTKAGEGCVIERLEDKAVVREMSGDRVFTGNHFESSLNDVGAGWKARPLKSHDRVKAAQCINPKEVDKEGFQWFTAPIANKFSRIVMVADAATGEFKVAGTEGGKLVTKIFKYSEAGHKHV